jgi:hypothetical protein
MKRIICHLLLACFLLLGVSTLCKADAIVLNKRTSILRAPGRTPQTQQQSLTASINENLILFQSSQDIEDVTVSIVSSDGTIVYSETTDMVTGMQYNISMDNYNSGNYSVIFKCGSVTYQGDFLIR